MHPCAPPNERGSPAGLRAVAIAGKLFWWGGLAILVLLPRPARAGAKEELAALRARYAKYSYSRYPAGVAALEAFLSKCSGDTAESAAALDLLGNLHYGRQRYPEAVARYEEIVEKHTAQKGLHRKALARLAWSYYKSQKYAEAAKTFEKLLQCADEKKSRIPQRLYYLAVCQANSAQHDAAIETYRKVLQEHPNHSYAIHSLKNLASAYSTKGDADQSVQRYTEFLEKYPERRTDCASAQLSIGYALRRAQRYDEALPALNRARREYPEVRATCASALIEVAYCHQYRTPPDLESALAAYDELIDEYREQSYYRLRALHQMGAMLGGAKRHDECRVAHEKLLSEYPEPDRNASGSRYSTAYYCRYYRRLALGALASSYVSEERWDEAALAHQRIICQYPHERSTALAAQRGIVDALTKAGRPKDALAAAKIYFGACDTDPSSLVQAMNLVADAFKTLEQDDRQADEFLMFQRCGPYGPDGKEGTNDDLSNPLERVSATVSEGAAKRFEAAVKACADDAVGRRDRGYLYLFWGKPKLALKEFATELAICEVDESALDQAANDLFVALKALRGFRPSDDDLHQFLKHGPAGPDGKPGTKDDLRNPLEAVR